MGNCFESCLPKTEKSFNILSTRGQGSTLDFTYLVEDNPSTKQEKNGNLFSRIFRKGNDNNNKKPVLQLMDGFLNPPNSYSRLNESQRLPSTTSCTSRDIQLQCLDARALLARTTTSTPASSLDLEWEHETVPISMIHDPSGSSWTALPDEYSHCPSESSQQATAPGESEWSRVSSANSLEWDNVNNSIQANSPISEIDTDTQLLLCEIERLTSKTLSETGQDLCS